MEADTGHARGGLIGDALRALVLLTTIPAAVPGGWPEERLPRSAAFFPLVGAVLGLGLWALDAAITAVLPGDGLVNATALLIALFLLTGGLHLDGLADTGDGLFSRTEREKALEIMRDSRTGALGAASLVLALLLKLAVLASLGPAVRGAGLLGALVAGRQAMVLAMAAFPAAQPDGLGRHFARRVPAWGVVVSIMLSLAALVGVAATGLVTVPVVLGAGAAALALAFGGAALIARRLGGMTGDVYGTVNEIGEMAFLLGFLLLRA